MNASFAPDAFCGPPHPHRVTIVTDGPEIMAIATEVQALASALPEPLCTQFFKALHEAFSRRLIYQEVVRAVWATVIQTEVVPTDLYRNLLMALRAGDDDAIERFAHGDLRET